MQLYERCGFRRAGHLRNYYSDNREDAIVMLLDGLTAAEPPQALTLARRGEALARRKAARGLRGTAMQWGAAYEAAAASLSASSSSAAGSWT